MDSNQRWSKLNIGLHSQTLNRSDGVIAGSEITTLGLLRAFHKRQKVDKITRFGPGNYRNLDNDHLDIIIIEGWEPNLPLFIELVRLHHKDTKIYFWNLSLHGIKEVSELDVDGYFTNSVKAVTFFETIAPTELISLAADPDEFFPKVPDDRYCHLVVYLGIYHPNKSERIIDRLLCEAIPFGLVIYGYGWGKHQILKRYWRGILPKEDIPNLYSSAKIVLGITEDRQKVAGMINNRVYEALACGACFVSDHFPELENTFGELILYSRKKGDTSKVLADLLAQPLKREQLGILGREFIYKQHTYVHRVEQMLDFHYRLNGISEI